MDLPILIILAVVCVSIGFVLDNLLHFMRREKAPDSASPPGEAAPKPEDAPQTGSVPPPPSGSEPAFEEVFSVWRRPLEKDLAVEVSGKKAHSSSDLDRDQLDRLAAALQELSAWLGRGVSTPGPVSPSSLPAASPATVPGLGNGVPVENIDSGEIRRPSLNPIDMVANALRSEIRKPPSPAEKSLATQVDAVLQEKIKGTPMEKRGIRLADAPDGSLQVQVGIEKYGGVEEVPDNEIREMIQAAVAEWGRRTLPRK